MHFSSRLKICTMFEEIVLQIKTFFYTIIFLLSIIPFLVLILPITLVRFIASKVAKILRPDLHKLVHPRSSVLSCDKYDTDPRWNVVVWLTQEGVMDLDAFRTDFHTNFVQAKCPITGQLKYPEYQQHYETWWGFQFWRWEDSFNIRQHIRHYDGQHQGSVVDDKRLLQIIKELTWKPWDAKNSPWEFLQIPNYQMTNDPTPQVSKSILIFRLHHGLGDGYYILKLLLEDIGGVNLKDRLGIPSIPKRSLFSKILISAFIWLVGPYHSMKMATRAFDRNSWRIPEHKMTKPMNAALTEPIKLDLIKKVKNSHEVSFSSVVNAAVAGGIRRMMISKGVPVPENVHIAVPIPIPEHPDKLRNHFIFSFVALPTGISDPIRRLKVANRNINELKRSTAPFLNFMLVPLFGSIYPCMINFLFKNRHSTCLLSNFPGTPLAESINGCKVIDMMFGAGTGPGRVGLGFTLISHTDHIRMLSVADSNILESDEEVEELNRKILQEIALLKDLTPFIETP